MAYGIFFAWIQIKDWIVSACLFRNGEMHLPHLYLTSRYFLTPAQGSPYTEFLAASAHQLRPLHCLTICPGEAPATQLVFALFPQLKRQSSGVIFC